ncbi:hypothetical protein KBD87_00185 [Candidatus Saccharibacteria bacterium]|nr:hypothetical protein [Candidatus Saccharibacteria bacterium]
MNEHDTTDSQKNDSAISETHEVVVKDYSEVSEASAKLDGQQPAQEIQVKTEPYQQVPPTETAVHEASKANPGVFVLQWLTYAFWGCSIAAMMLLFGYAVSYFLEGEAQSFFDLSSLMVYELAATVVLTIVAFACDRFYSKYEEATKTGVSMGIMVLHAVIFSLFGVSTMITVMYALVRMLVGEISDSQEPFVMLAWSLFGSGLYVAFLVRILWSGGKVMPAKRFRLAMLVLMLITVGLAIAGPVNATRQSRNDRLIADNLGKVSVAINQYAQENKALPHDLASITSKLDDKGAQLVKEKLVEYTPQTKPTSGVGVNTYGSYNEEQGYGGSSTATSSDSEGHWYQLCVKYVKASMNNSSYDGSGKERSTNPSTYSHAAGRVCYDLATYE